MAIREFFCVVDGKPIPQERADRGAVTCSKECADRREVMLRERKDETVCRWCKRPSTLLQRNAYARFRKLERKRPDLLYPAEFEAWMAREGNGSPESFAKWWRTKDQAASEEIAAAEAEPEPEPEPETEPEPEPAEHWYVFREEKFGKKGELCQILRMPNKRIGSSMVQIKFLDGYMPVVQRASLRTATAEQLKQLDVIAN